MNLLIFIEYKFIFPTLKVVLLTKFGSYYLSSISLPVSLSSFLLSTKYITELLLFCISFYFISMQIVLDDNKICIEIQKKLIKNNSNSVIYLVDSKNEGSYTGSEIEDK